MQYIWLKKKVFLDEILQIISDSTNEVKENAAECLCSTICIKYEDAFALVAENKGFGSSNQWTLQKLKQCLMRLEWMGQMHASYSIT